MTGKRGRETRGLGRVGRIQIKGLRSRSSGRRPAILFSGPFRSRAVIWSKGSSCIAAASGGQNGGRPMGILASICHAATAAIVTVMSTSLSTAKTTL